LGALAACSGSSDPSTSKSQQDLSICWFDSGICFDADIPTVPGPSSWPSYDGGAPSWPSFDAGAPSWPSFDAGWSVPQITHCGFDPKYYQEYMQVAASFSAKPCWKGCSATECCYANLACVPQ
jgi:hypothetical protein